MKMVAPRGALSEICPSGLRSGAGPVPLGGLIRSLPGPLQRNLAHHSPAARAHSPGRRRHDVSREGSTPQLAIVADQYDFVIGADTHAASHTLALITAGTGAVGQQAQFPTSPSGLRRAVDWIERHTHQSPTPIVIDSAGSYGATFTEQLSATGLTVAEAPDVAATTRRRRGKSDAVDAVAMAQAARSLDINELAWSHPGRVRSEAAFAALAGASPLPASSGNTTHYRLNRGGDRRLNRALYTVALVRMGHDPRTRDYVTRRTREGRTKREIMHSLKRYISRQLFRTLNGTHPATSTT
ncbi:transposase IS116/IS110/IS902 family protein [Salinispora tropica CNB-440]|uniref:Transposase IS116/IS110/IS902 family protein n=1 Tax=Salinispora tropica (strain ATCC BAA-916 / DSM 44818 / JCM 13857 / NBRC 105044 / CNB-440) TaxID=369723 RepID=A4X5H7_SALTO|nr:transposase IS116/IS110/IS902 family protein [Salinispora tropica CNB-440]